MQLKKVTIDPFDVTFDEKNFNFLLRQIHSMSIKEQIYRW